MKKKIIFVTMALWIGGIETALINLLNHFDYEKYEVTLLVIRAELDLLDQIPAQCCVLIVDRERAITFQKAYRHSRLYHLSEETNSPSAFHKKMMWTVPVIRWAENRLYIRYIRGLMRDEKFDTAIIYSDVVGEIAVRAIRADKYLMYYHHGAMRHVYHDAVAWKKCERIIAVSNLQARLLKKFFPQYAGKIVTIHNLIDVEGIRKKAVDEPEEIFDKKKYNIVSVGRVSHEKGMDLAVRACAKLVADGYNNIQWWIVGGGPAMQEVHDVIEETKLMNHVVMTGMRTNPYPYIRNADLYVQPSRFEGYPMTILEALVLGQPVVSTDNNGAREILTSEETGVLVSGETDKIAEAVEQLMNNTEEYREMKKNAHQIDFVMQNRKSLLKLERII